MCNFGKNFTVTLVALYSKPRLLLSIQGHQASYCKCITHEKWSPLAYLLSALAASLSASLFDAPSWGEHAAGNTKPPSHFWAGRHLPSAAGRQWQGGWVGLGSCDVSWTLAMRWIRQHSTKLLESGTLLDSYVWPLTLAAVKTEHPEMYQLCALFNKPISELHLAFIQEV